MNEYDTKAGALMTVYTVMMCQSVAATVSPTLQQPSIQFPAGKFHHTTGWAKLNGANAVSFVVVKHVLENFDNFGR